MQASKEFPVLLEYEGNWVVHDYLRIYLKNSSQRAKKDQQQKDKELEAAAKGKTKGTFATRSQVTLISLWVRGQLTLAHQSDCERRGICYCG
jgi:hypothetical protein